jgi:hypothetical protein
MDEVVEELEEEEALEENELENDPVSVVVTCIGGCKRNWVKRVWPTLLRSMSLPMKSDEYRYIPFVLARCLLCRGDMRVVMDGPAYSVQVVSVQDRLLSLVLMAGHLFGAVLASPRAKNMRSSFCKFCGAGAETGCEHSIIEWDGVDEETVEWTPVYDIDYIDTHSVKDGDIAWINKRGKLVVVDKEGEKVIL